MKKNGKKFKWKYTDSERPKKAQCHDCKKLYKDFPDFSIDNSKWELINPTYHEGAGILCPKCMVNRFNMLDINNIQGTFYWSKEWK